MKLPRFRFTVRRLMIAVTIVAVILAFPLWMQRRKANFRDQASRHTKVWSAYLPFPVISPPARAIHHWKLANKYYYAAQYPWLPVSRRPARASMNSFVCKR